MCGAIGSTASRRRRTERLAMDANRTVPLLILIASAALVGGALLFQHVGGLQPCELCLYQRWPYYTVIVLSALALAAGHPAITSMVTGIAALAFLIGAGLAFYHVGVEPQWALFGVSLAGWNLLASAALVIFCLLALRAPALRGRAA